MNLTTILVAIRILRHLSPSRRRQLLLLGFLMIFMLFVEMVSLSAILPFLAVLSSPDAVIGNPILRSFANSFNLNEQENLIFLITFLFILMAVVSGSVRLGTFWMQARLSAAIGSDLSVRAYERTLYQRYEVHLKRNTSDILAGSQKANNLVFMFVQPLLNLISSILIIFAVLFVLMTVNSLITVYILFGFAGIYFLVAICTRESLAKNGKVIAEQHGKVLKVMQEGLGGIRDILIDGTQAMYTKAYHDALMPMKTSQANNQILSQTPRYGVETLGMVLIASAALYMFEPEVGIAHAIPFLGALALGAQKLLPATQQLYAAYTTLAGYKSSVGDAIALLEQPLPQNALRLEGGPLPFESQIRLKSVSFRYSSGAGWVIRNLNLDIRKGSVVGFIGPTGAGKSTLIDIVMGLLTPSEGQIIVDDIELNQNNIRSWQVHIAHVPQAIFLADSTIEENIAFGQPVGSIDRQRVIQAAEKARIASSIEALPEQYKTLVGERGIRLSGGQRQRIGIARALYKKADVIIFDEATSALDSETEQAVMDAIESLSADLTILIVAHRLTTLKKCSKIVEVNEGAIQRIVTFEDLVFEPASAANNAKEA